MFSGGRRVIANEMRLRLGFGVRSAKFGTNDPDILNPPAPVTYRALLHCASPYRLKSRLTSPAEAVNAAVFRQIIEMLASDARFCAFEAPLNSDTFFWACLHPQSGGFADVEAYRRYRGRLRDLPRYFEQHQDKRSRKQSTGRGLGSDPRETAPGRGASLGCRSAPRQCLR